MAVSKLILDIVARDQASATLKKLGIGVDGSVNKMELLNKASNAAAIGLAAWTAVAVASVKAAAEESGQQARLAQTLGQATGATASQAAATDEMLTQMGLATGVADDQLRPALQKLAIATGDLNTSQELLGVALDASVALGKDVESVAVALGKAYNGNVGALGRLGLATKDAEGNTLEFGDIMDDLKSKTEGAAEAAGEAEPWKRLQVSVGEAQESIGGALLPVVSKVSDELADLGPGAIQAGFAVTGIGLAALTVIPKAIQMRNALRDAGVTLDLMKTKTSGAVGSLRGLGVVGGVAATGGLAAALVAINAIANDAAASERAIDGMTAALDTPTNADDLQQLSDTLNELPSFAERAINPLNGMWGSAQRATATLDELGVSIADVQAHLRDSDHEWGDYVQSLVDMAIANGESAATQNALRYALDKSRTGFAGATENTERATDALTENERAVASDADALEKLTGKVNEASNAWRRYVGLPLDAAEAGFAFQESVRNTISVLKNEDSTRAETGRAIIAQLRAMEDLREANIESGMKANEANRIYETQRQRLLDVARQAGLAKKDIERLIGTLGRIPKQTTANVSVNVQVHGNQGNIPDQATANGGPVAAANGRYLVGEHGPEILTLSRQSGRVIPHSRSMTRMGGGGDVYFTGPVYGDPAEFGRYVKRSLAMSDRRTGRGALGAA